MSCDILKVQKVQKPEKWAKPFNTAIAELRAAHVHSRSEEVAH